MRIMVCYDGNPDAERALSKTLRLFGPLKPEIILLSVIEANRDASPEADERYARWLKERSEILKSKAEEIVARGFEVDAVLAEGNSREMVLRAAESKKPDILVVGKRQGGTLADMLHASLSVYLVHHAACPVLVFHREG